MKELSGKTSDRIRSGKIPADALPKGRDVLEPAPSAEAVKCGEGHGLGNGANRSGRD